MEMQRLGQDMLARALALPETAEHWPWGQRVIKVRGKIFLFLEFSVDTLSVSLKLPQSHEFALMFPECVPTGYGLGKAGWISCRLDPESSLDPDLLVGWLSESYRAIAPKKLLATLPPA